MSIVMIHFRGRSFDLRQGESVLECLERSGERLPASCRSGVCQSCLLQATSGEVPPASQKGLRPSLKRRGCVLACACRPNGDLALATIDAFQEFESKVVEARRVSGSVFRVLLERPLALEYEAGQFVQVVRPSDGLTRPYSLASLPTDDCLELHVAVRAQGRMSRWLTQSVGQQVLLKGPMGECTFQATSPQTPLLLFATGTGLAPLIGVLRSALSQNHQGKVLLCHGSRRLEGLYLWQSLLELAERHPQLELQGWVQEPPRELAPRVWLGRLEPSLLEARPDVTEAEIYLCGNPELVHRFKKWAYLKGACLSRIHADPFLEAPPAASSEALGVHERVPPAEELATVLHAD